MRHGTVRAVGRTRIGRPDLRAGRAPWLGWIAVFAILIQTLVPNFAMAARAAAGAGMPPVKGLCAADAARYAHAPDRPSDQARDPASPTLSGHEAPCAFCLALSTHGMPPGTGNGLERTGYGGGTAATLGAGVPPRPLFRHSRSPRAPPESGSPGA